MTPGRWGLLLVITGLLGLVWWARAPGPSPGPVPEVDGPTVRGPVPPPVAFIDVPSVGSRTTIDVTVERADGSVVRGARVRAFRATPSVEPRGQGGGWRGGECFPGGADVAAAALRRQGTARTLLGEAQSNAEGLASVELSARAEAIQLVVDDAATGERGTQWLAPPPAEGSARTSVMLFASTPARLTIAPPTGGATVLVYDPFEGTLLDAPVSASGEVALGAVSSGIAFVEQPGSEAFALSLGPGPMMRTVVLVPLRASVEVQLPPRFGASRVEVRDGCRVWEQQASGGLAIFKALPAGSVAVVSLLDDGRHEVLDAVGTSPLVADERAVVRLGWEPGARLVVKVLDASGAPVPSTVEVESHARGDSPKTSANSGMVRQLPPLTLGPVVPGPATLSIEAEGFTDSEETVQLRAGLNELTVRLTAEAGLVLVTGKVLHHAGHQVAPLGANAQTRCSEDGRCERPPPGGYVEVDLVASLIHAPSQESGALRVISYDGALSGHLSRGRWAVRGWGSDGTLLRPTTFDVPGPPVVLHLMPPSSDR